MRLLQCPGWVLTYDLSPVMTLNARYLWWTDRGTNASWAKNVTPSFENGIFRYGDLDGETPPLALTANLTNSSAAGAALDLSTRGVRPTWLGALRALR